MKGNRLFRETNCDFREINSVRTNKKSMTISIDIGRENANRFQDYVSFARENNDHSVLTNHWKKRIDKNLKVFQVRQGKIFIDNAEHNGLDLNYSCNFVKQREPLKKILKRKILNHWGVYTSHGFDPVRHFGRFWPKGSGFYCVEDIMHKKRFAADRGYKAYWFFNELHNVLQQENITVNCYLEIGPGPGNLVRLMRKNLAAKQNVLVDIPVSLCFSFANLIKEFPDATFVLPHEERANGWPAADFVFLTDSQIDQVPDGIVDVAVNTMSFGEMREEIVAGYFQFLRRVLGEENVFYCVNRVEKWMTYEGKKITNRFIDYPWSANDKVFDFAISNVERDINQNPIMKKIVRLART